jgi:hypothetical protein
VREGTISEMINGKRLPRWETVEPVAWALGGQAAVDACRQRWIEADAARTPSARHDPQPGPPAQPGTIPAAAATAVEPAPGPPDGPGQPEEPGKPGETVRRRARWLLAAGATALAAVVTALVYTTVLPGSGHHTHPGTPATAATQSPSHAVGHTAGPSPSPPSSAALPLTPSTTLLTVHSSHPTSTRDGLVTISVLSVNGNNTPGAVYSVITPWTTCQVQGGDVGRSVVIKIPAGSWIRLVITDFPPSSNTDATSPDFDIPINFQITRGHSHPPQATQTCH